MKFKMVYLFDGVFPLTVHFKICNEHIIDSRELWDYAYDKAKEICGNRHILKSLEVI